MTLNKRGRPADSANIYTCSFPDVYAFANTAPPLLTTICLARSRDRVLPNLTRYVSNSRSRKEGTDAVTLAVDTKYIRTNIDISKD